jgi:hypothetical protein
LPGRSPIGSTGSLPLKSQNLPPPTWPKPSKARAIAPSKPPRSTSSAPLSSTATVPDLIVLDPPRTGAGPEICALLARPHRRAHPHLRLLLARDSARRPGNPHRLRLPHRRSSTCSTFSPRPPTSKLSPSSPADPTSPVCKTVFSPIANLSKEPSAAFPPQVWFNREERRVACCGKPLVFPDPNPNNARSAASGREPRASSRSASAAPRCSPPPSASPRRVPHQNPARSLAPHHPALRRARSRRAHPAGPAPTLRLAIFPGPRALDRRRPVVRADRSPRPRRRPLCCLRRRPQPHRRSPRRPHPHPARAHRSQRPTPTPIPTSGKRPLERVRTPPHHLHRPRPHRHRRRHARHLPHGPHRRNRRRPRHALRRSRPRQSQIQPQPALHCGDLVSAPPPPARARALPRSRRVAVRRLPARPEHRRHRQPPPPQSCHEHLIPLTRPRSQTFLRAATILHCRIFAAQPGPPRACSPTPAPPPTAACPRSSASPPTTPACSTPCSSATARASPTPCASASSAPAPSTSSSSPECMSPCSPACSSSSSAACASANGPPRCSPSLSPSPTRCSPASACPSSALY